MKNNKYRVDPDSIKLFEKWKESEDYLIQSWFMIKSKELKDWFDNQTKESPLVGFTLNDFTWSQSDTYLIYTAFAEFSEKLYEYKLDFIVEMEKVVDGQVSDFELVLTGYNLNSDVLGKTNKYIKTKDFNIDYLIAMIAEFKTLYANNDKDANINPDVLINTSQEPKEVGNTTLDQQNTPLMPNNPSLSNPSNQL